MRSVLSSRIAPYLAVAVAAGFTLIASPPASSAAPVKDDTPTLLTPKGEHGSDADEGGTFDKLRDAYYWSRLLSGDNPISLGQAAQLRSKAASKAATISNNAVRGAARGGTWTSQGPNPIVQNGRT